MKVLDAQALLADAQAGRPDWDAIYRLVRRPMYIAAGYALRPCRSYEGLCHEDVVASAMQELMRKDLQSVTSLVGTARTLAYRRAIDLVRRCYREVPCDALAEVGDDEVLAEELERRERLLDRLLTLVDQLPDDLQVVIEETVIRGRSCTALGKELRISHQAISKRRKRALRQLRKWLAEDEPGRDDSAKEESA